MSRFSILSILTLLGLLAASASCAEAPGPGPTGTPSAPAANRSYTPYVTVTPSVTPTPSITQALTTEPQPTQTPAAGLDVQPAAPPHFSAGEQPTLTEIHMVTVREGWALSGPYVLVTADGGRTWLEVTPPEPAFADVDVTLQAYAGFLDAQTAWVVYGQIGLPQRGHDTYLPPDVGVWHTSDGGLNWQASTPLQHQLYSQYGPITTKATIAAVDAQNAWFLIQGSFVAAGLKTPAQLFLTTDGGITWEPIAGSWSFSDGNPLPVPPLPFNFTGMRFADSRIGWLIWQTVGAYYQDLPSYAVTGDGGVNWQIHSLPPPADRLSLVQEYTYCEPTQLELPAADSIRLILDCYEGDSPEVSYLYASDDSGATWRTYPLPVSRSAEWPYQLRFFDANNGLLLGQTIYRTSDGGRTWQRVRILAWDRGQFSFVDPQHGWAIPVVGEATGLVSTSDGGRLWAEIEPAAGEPLTIGWISMMTPEIGWTFGSVELGSPLLRTADGGQTWRDVTPQLGSSSIRRLLVLDANTAWLVLEEEARDTNPLARTTDGGASWTILPGGLPFFVSDMTVRFSDRLHGWILSGGAAAGTASYNLHETYDGGVTWARTRISYPWDIEGTGTLEVCNICGDRVYVDGSRLIVTRGSLANPPNGTVNMEVTTNRGQTWRHLALPYPPGLPADAEVDPGYDLTFFGSTGYLKVTFWVGGYEKRELAVYVTRDGGTTWQARPEVFPIPVFTDFASPIDGFLVWQGALYASHDTAATWRIVNPEFDSAFLGETFKWLDFVSATTGWAFSESSPGGERIWWRTTDGGNTWTRLSPLLVP